MPLHRPSRFFSDATIDDGSARTGHISIRPHRMFMALAASPHLTLRERRLLTACLLMREIYDTEMKTMALDKSRVVREQQQYNSHLREKLLSGKGVRSRWFLFRHGEDAATDLDFNLDEWITEERQKADNAQRERRGEVNAYATAREERWRDALESASPYAKKLFNDISVTGRSLTHFPERDIRPAAELPDLRALADSAPALVKVSFG